MGSILGKSGNSAVTGYRYYFAVLAGICRGPIDEIFLIKSADNILFDGSVNVFQDSGASAIITFNNAADPDPSGPQADGSDLNYAGGTITDNTSFPLFKPDIYGGDEREGGIGGWFWVYMGAKDQLISASDWIRTAMDGLFLPALRGVVTTFFDGEVTANNPYPKAWKYRVRRTLKGWDGDVWYPEKATILMTDSAVPAYLRGVGDTGPTMTTEYYSPGGIDPTGASTSSGSVTEVTSNYTGATITTYGASDTISTVYAVPREYNEIKAMNPAHIIFETCTNRDWGRGMDRALIDHVSFAAAADTLYDEGFGLCIKWSRTEEIDVFLQTVIDHIGGVVYTDKVTGLLSLRLIRNDYNPAQLSVFDYNSGLLEVTSVETSASDTNPNEVIVKYRSPVLDADKQARQQNAASISALGAINSVNRDYSGIPTSDLAVRVAARDLRILSNPWKKVQFKVDRRGYLITPGDCLVLSAPDRNLYNIVLRVGTVEDSVMTDGTITVTGSQDAFGLPATALSTPQKSEWFPVDTQPRPVTDQFGLEATYWDLYKATAGNPALFEEYTADGEIAFQVIFASAPNNAALNFKAVSAKHVHLSSVVEPYKEAGIGNFSRSAKLQEPISTTATTFKISNGLNPSVIRIPQLMLLIGGDGLSKNDNPELVYVTALTRDPTTRQLTATAKRGCIDTYGRTHPLNTRLFAYEQYVIVDSNEYTVNDIAETALITHSTRGDLTYNTLGDLPRTLTSFFGRIGNPYPGSDFRVNGYPRDATPPVDPLAATSVVFTWHHRNKVTQGDQPVGEVEADVSAPGTVSYFVTIYNSDSIHHVTTSNTTSNTVTVAVADLVAAGVVDTMARASLHTIDSGVPFNVQGSYMTPFCDFYIGTPTTGTGFNYDFDNNFGS